MAGTPYNGHASYVVLRIYLLDPFCRHLVPSTLGPFTNVVDTSQ